MSTTKNWTHVEALKAAKVFRKHGVPCRVHQTNHPNANQLANDSYLVVYKEKDGKTYELDAAYEECRELYIETEFKQLRQIS